MYGKRIPILLTSAIALAMISSGLVMAQKPAPKLSREYPLTIDGTATMVGKWVCGGEAKFDVQPAADADRVPGLNAGVQSVSVTTSVPKIDCGDSTMNKHLQKALKMDEYPQIRYKATGYTLVDNGAAVQTSGEMTIAGVTKPVVLGAKLAAQPEGGIRITGKVDINMVEYGVKPPSLFFGTLKVANVVTVKFDTIVQLPNEVTQSLILNK